MSNRYTFGRFFDDRAIQLQCQAAFLFPGVRAENHNTYRSMIVMMGQIRAPAAAALAASAANLSPKLRVFHCLSNFVVGIGMAGTAGCAASRDMVIANFVGDSKKGSGEREMVRMI